MLQTEKAKHIDLRDLSKVNLLGGSSQLVITKSFTYVNGAGTEPYKAIFGVIFPYISLTYSLDR